MPCIPRLHGAIDVGELDCDFLACSTYKFFGPHMGVLYGKREHLARLQPYKVRANTNAFPQRWSGARSITNASRESPRAWNILRS